MQKILRQRRCLGMVVGLMCALIGCGGGDDESPSRTNTSNVVPNECITYCNFVCAKLGVCKHFSTSEVNTCATACVDTIEQQGIATAQSCQAAFNRAAESDC